MRSRSTVNADRLCVGKVAILHAVVRTLLSGSSALVLPPRGRSLLIALRARELPQALYRTGP